MYRLAGLGRAISEVAVLEIAGGILIAVAILLALPLIIAVAAWCVIIGVGFAAVFGAWFVLEPMVGESWANAICAQGITTVVGTVISLRSGEKIGNSLLSGSCILPVLAIIIVLGLAAILGLVAIIGGFGYGLFVVGGWAFGPIGAYVCACFSLPIYLYGLVRAEKWWKQRTPGPILKWYRRWMPVPEKPKSVTQLQEEFLRSSVEKGCSGG